MLEGQTSRGRLREFIPACVYKSSSRTGNEQKKMKGNARPCHKARDSKNVHRCTQTARIDSNFQRHCSTHPLKARSNLDLEPNLFEQSFYPTTVHPPSLRSSAANCTVPPQTRQPPYPCTLPHSLLPSLPLFCLPGGLFHQRRQPFSPFLLLRGPLFVVALIQGPHPPSSQGLAPPQRRGACPCPQTLCTLLVKGVHHLLIEFNDVVRPWTVPCKGSFT